MIKRFICSIILCMMSAVVSATTADVIIQWEAPKTFENGRKLDSEKDILFYTIYYSRSANYRKNPDLYERMVVIHPSQRFVLINNLRRVRYHFWATATSVDLEESRPSNMITRNFKRKRYARPIILILDDEKEIDYEDKICTSLQKYRRDNCRFKYRK